MEWDPRVNDILAQAVEIESNDERAVFLDQSCGQDKALRAAVEELLVSHRKAGSFLEKPAIGINRTVDIDPRALEAGLAATFTSDAALVIGDAGHSVLKSIGKTLNRTPHVTLRDENKDPASASTDGQSETGSRYQLEGEIARGGMGAILKGRDADLGRDLAIKVLLDSHKDNPDAVARFVEEAQIGGQLQHPGIVPVHELGQFSDDRPYFSMKLVQGETLGAMLGNRKDPGEDRPKFLGIFEQICQTMAYAHSRGVIHRDLKPANIMVGAFGEVQVMDWGLAKVLGDTSVADTLQRKEHQQDTEVVQTQRSGDSDSPDAGASQTRMGSVMGTPAYMPPEQALGEIDRLDERADVFGLGAILAEILTGKPPYVGEDGAEVYRKAARGDLEDCFARLDACQSEHELVEFAKKSLTAEAEGRLPNAGEMAAGMTEYLLGVQERLKQAELGRVEAQARAEEERRRRKLHLALAGVMLLLAVGTAFAAARFRRQREENRQLAVKEIAAREDAENKTRVATVMRMAAQSQSIREELPGTSVLLAMEAVESARRHDGTTMPVAHETLLSATHNIGGRLLIGHKDRINAVAISPDSRWVVTASVDTTVRLWRLAADDLAAASIILQGTEVGGRVGGQHRTGISPDGRWLAIGGADENPLVQIWDLTADNPVANAFTLNGHQDRIISMAFGLDGNRLAIASADHTVRLWDLTAEAASEPLFELPHDDSVNSVAIGPRNRWLATVCDDGTARLWDLTADSPAASSLVLTGHTDKVGSVTISPNGQWLATRSLDTTVRLWSLTAEHPAASSFVLGGHEYGISAMAISLDSRWLVTGSMDNTARLWNLTAEDPAASSIVLRGHDRLVWRLAISPDSRWLVTGSEDGTARLWNLDADNPAASSLVLRGHHYGITSMVISADSRWLVTGGHDCVVRLWDLHDKDPAASPSALLAHEDTVPDGCVAIDPNSRWLVTGSWDGTARLWDLHSENPASPLVMFNQGSIQNSMETSPDGRRLVTVGDDRSLQVWEFTTSGQDPFYRSRVLHGHEGEVTSVAVGDRHVATGSQDGNARVWDLREPAAPPQVLQSSGDLIWSVLISPNGRWLAIGNNDKRAELWDLKDPDPSPQQLDGYQTIGNGPYKIPIAMSRDGKWLATADGVAVRLWDLTASDPVSSAVLLPEVRESPQLTTGETTDVRIGRLAFSPDSRWLLTQHSGGLVGVWDFNEETSAQSWRILSGHTVFVHAVAVDAGSRRLLTASWDETARVWDLADPSAPSILLGSETGAVYAAAFSPDGRRVATGGHDNMARVWDLEHPGEPWLVLRGHQSFVNALAYIPDSRWIITRSNDRTVRLWDLNIDSLVRRARRLVGRELNEDEKREYGIGTLESP